MAAQFIKSQFDNFFLPKPDEEAEVKVAETEAVNIEDELQKESIGKKKLKKKQSKMPDDAYEVVTEHKLKGEWTKEDKSVWPLQLAHTLLPEEVHDGSGGDKDDGTLAEKLGLVREDKKSTNDSATVLS